MRNNNLACERLSDREVFLKNQGILVSSVVVQVGEKDVIRIGVFNDSIIVQSIEGSPLRVFEIEGKLSVGRKTEEIRHEIGK